MRRALIFALLTPLAGCFATQKDVDAANARAAEDRRQLAETRLVVEAQTREMAHLSDALTATQTRLDNALRANADTGMDLIGEKQRVNQLAGRLDEVDHGLVDVRRDLGVSRAEVDGRLDELKRALDAQANKPPPVTIPADKEAHFLALESARVGKDTALLRTLGREFVTRYPFDERADDVLYYLGEAELADGHPAAALGSFNRVLKSHPKSNVLGPTFLAMGEAYLALHDCDSARLAFGACQSKFAKEKAGKDAAARMSMLAKPPAGLCAPTP